MLLVKHVVDSFFPIWTPLHRPSHSLWQSKYITIHQTNNDLDQERTRVELVLFIIKLTLLFIGLTFYESPIFAII